MTYLDLIPERRLLALRRFSISTQWAPFTLVESVVASHPMETKPGLSVFLVEGCGRLAAASALAASMSGLVSYSMTVMMSLIHGSPYIGHPFPPQDRPLRRPPSEPRQVSRPACPSGAWLTEPTHSLEGENDGYLKSRSLSLRMDSTCAGS